METLFFSVCENRKWRCTEKVCDGVCRTVGEGHYITFDGLKYSFPGLCQYVLVQVRERFIVIREVGRVYYKNKLKDIYVCHFVTFHLGYV